MKNNTNLIYTEVRTYTTSIKGNPVLFYTKPGLPDWERVTPASMLIAEYTQVLPEERILIMGCSHGAFIVPIAQQLSAGELLLYDPNIIAQDMTRRTLEANSINNAQYFDDPIHISDIHLPVDKVVINAPKGRKLTRRWLVRAYNALSVGGILFIAGPNRLGIQSLIKDAKSLFIEEKVLGYRKGNRIVKFRKPEDSIFHPEWLDEPGIAPNTWCEFTLAINNQKYNVRSLPGIFSYDHLDSGTDLLLNNLTISTGSSVADLGCGYGIIGMVIARSGAEHVDFLDINLAAVSATRENLLINEIGNSEVYPSDVLNAVIDKKFDLVVSNPPFHAGQPIDLSISKAIIEQSWQVLLPGGQLIIVANKFIPYQEILNRKFRGVTNIAETNRYNVLTAIK